MHCSTPILKSPSAPVSDYHRRLERTTAALQAAVALHHATHGTTAPPPSTVSVQTIVEDHAIVAFPVDGDDEPHRIGMNLPTPEDASDGRHAARIVDKAGLWQRWHPRVAAADKTVEEALRRMTVDTRVEILGVRRNDVSGSPDEVSIDYRADVRQLDGSLRPVNATWSVTRYENDSGKMDWRLRENASLLPTQRRLARMLAAAGDRPRLLVEQALARTLTRMPERNEAWKRLFAAANGQVGTKVPWRSVTLLEAREGRIVATIPLSQKARIRSDTITIKGQTLPQTVQTAMAGRAVESMVEHPLLAGRTIRRVRSTRTDTIIELERDDVEYEQLRTALEGERK